jgi:hypothetical protein
MVLEVRRLLLLPLDEVNSDVLIRDVALLCNECYAVRASRQVESVEFERGAHDASTGFRGVPIESYTVFRLRVHWYSHNQSDVMIVRIP